MKERVMGGRRKERKEGRKLGRMEEIKEGRREGRNEAKTENLSIKGTRPIRPTMRPHDDEMIVWWWDCMRHHYLRSKSSIIPFLTKAWPTDGRTDGRTDRPFYRDARRHPKRERCINLESCDFPRTSSAFVHYEYSLYLIRCTLHAQRSVIRIPYFVFDLKGINHVQMYRSHHLLQFTKQNQICPTTIAIRATTIAIHATSRDSLSGCVVPVPEVFNSNFWSMIAIT